MQKNLAVVSDDAAQTSQYLTFEVGNETYSIGIRGIKEIIEYGKLTAVPMMPPFIRGVINLRGAVVPVLDLLARFGQGRSETRRRTCIVIVEADNGGEPIDLGILVDAVDEVVGIPAADIEPVPCFGSMDPRFIVGLGKVAERFVAILDIDRIANSAHLPAQTRLVSTDRMPVPALPA